VSLSTRVLIGLFLGIACGLFFGEGARYVEVLGRAFVLLLQMTVLPYMAVSLVAGLGRVSVAQALSLAKRAGSFLVLLWGLALAAVLCAPLAFPRWEAASFFSTNLIEAPTRIDFLDLFIPANPFRSLAAAIVPSVVVFCVALGVALIGIAEEKKRGLIIGLETISDALGRITGFVVELAPYGVFAIAANAAGTLSLDDAQGLQVYAAVYVGLALVLTLWTLPGLVAALTPFRYREVMWDMRDALVTCFATGSLFVVLSVLAERTKALLQRHSENANPENCDTLVDVVIPTSFTFPSAGKLLTLSYLLFAGWLSGYAVPVGQYASFLATGVASFFGSTLVAVPFLLDLFKIPADLFQLFVAADNLVGGRFGSTLAAMHTIALVLLSASAMFGWIRVRPMALARYVAVTLLLTLGLVFGVRVCFELRGREYEGYSRFVEMQAIRPRAEARVLQAPPDPLPPRTPGASALDRIRARGVLRVGYLSGRLPYVFRNVRGELVGLDVEMAHQLALELGARLELVKIDRAALAGLLDAGYLDTVMSGYAVTTERLQETSFSQSYADETLAFVVRDHRREEFSSRTAAKAHKTLRLAMPPLPYYERKVRRYLPQAELVPITSPQDFFGAPEGAYDGVVFTAESGSAWTLVYPAFAVAVPHPDVLKVPLAYPVARGDARMVEFLNAWIELKRKDETIEALYAHWILGEDAVVAGPRWSVIRDVLHWVE